MRPLNRRLIGLAWRLAVAIALTAIAFWLGTNPNAPRIFGFGAAVRVWRVLEAPIAGLNAVLPVWLKTSAASMSHFCFPTLRHLEVLRYMAIGVPAYVFLLYAPLALAALWRRRRVSAPVRGGA